MKAVIIYTRFSPRPNADQCMSCEFQEMKAREYCEYRGWDVRQVFQDKAKSGKSMKNRPGLKEALNIVLGNHLTLVANDMSRISRSVLDMCDLMTRFNKRDACLVLLKENIDTRTAMGRFFFHIMASLAQLEREQTSERTSATFQAMRKEGRKIGAEAPWGWKVDESTVGRVINNVKMPVYLKKNPEEQKTVRLICELHRGGMNKTRMCRELTKRRIEPRGKKWHESTIRQILKNNYKAL